MTAWMVLAACLSRVLLEAVPNSSVFAGLRALYGLLAVNSRCSDIIRRASHLHEEALLYSSVILTVTLSWVFGKLRDKSPPSSLQTLLCRREEEHVASSISYITTTTPTP